MPVVLIRYSSKPFRPQEERASPGAGPGDVSLVDLGPGQLGPGQLGPAMANLDVAMAKPGREHPVLAVAAGRHCPAVLPRCVSLPCCLAEITGFRQAPCKMSHSKNKGRTARGTTCLHRPLWHCSSSSSRTSPCCLSQKRCFIFSPQNMRQDVHPTHRVAQRAATSGDQRAPRASNPPGWLRALPEASGS